MKTIIIAEAGVNHNGSLDLAKKLVDVAVNAHVDYVKFQVGIPELVASKIARKADYQKQTTGDGNQLDMIKKISLTFREHAELKDYCDSVQIKYLCTPFDLHSIDFLESINIPLWKIPSGEVTNYPYLKRIAQTKKPVILSTGMCTMDDIQASIHVLTSNGAKIEDITILHCNTEYPTPMDDVNLKAMQHIAKKFNLKAGYSDHTLGIEVPIAAVALGAEVVEKHFTLDRNMEGPDHKASLEPHELKQMVIAIRNIEKALGSEEKKITLSEQKNMVIARKSIIAAKFIAKGEVFTEANLTVKRPGNGISPMYWDRIIGKVADQDYDADDLIELSLDYNSLISIIIPVNNVESEYLIPCIDSVVNQTYHHLEIILINDYSTDPHVSQIFQQYKKKDDRIIIIENTIHQGVSLSRQYGIDIAKGQYLFFIDGDDYITQDCIASLLDEAIQTNADIVIGDHWLTYKTHKIYQSHDYKTNEPNGYLKALLTGKCGRVVWNKLIKTEKIKQLELPNIYLRCNDVMVNYIIANQHFLIIHLKRPLYNWVQRKTSETHTKSKSSIEHAIYMTNWVNDYVSNHFTSTNLENELAFNNLSVWALLVAHGLKRPYSYEANEFKNNIYTKYWKNKWAKKQLNLKNKLIIQFNKNSFLSIFYRAYFKFLKPFFYQT